MVKSFLAGALAGGAIVWIWRDRIEEMIDDATSNVRARTAEQLHGAADTLQNVAATVEEGLTGTPPQPRAS